MSSNDLSSNDFERVDDLALAWDTRIARLLDRLPARMSAFVAGLRRPDRRLLRILVALLLTLGGVLSILPVLGIWMLPLGLALLAEDMPGLKPRLEGASRRIEKLWQRLRRRSA